MGFSALDGLMMGTRSGSLDAGVLLYLLEQGWDAKRIEKLLYKESGLLGVSGISADMRTLRGEAAQGNADATRAIDQFTHRVIRETGALTACLGGLDLIAFSGGIGENDAVLRAQLCSQLAWLGVQIDPLANDAATGETVTAIHTPGSKVEVWVVPTDEGLVAAMDAAKLVTPE
jgi:acetate kinase